MKGGGFVLSVKNNQEIMRGEVWLAELSQDTVGCEQKGIRPVVVIQNNEGNIHSPCVIIATVTSRYNKGSYLPTHVDVGTEGGLSKHSTVMLEQIRTIDKSRLIKYVGVFTPNTMRRINQALMISFALQTIKA